MKKIILLLLSILLLTGCDYIEIEDLVIITGIIIDYKDNNYVLTSQVLENEDKTIIKNYTTTGNTIDEALYKLSKYSNKDIFISHMKVLLLTENTIKNNVNYYDYFIRNSKSKMNFYVYLINDEIKEKILDQDNNSIYLKELTDLNSKVFSSSAKTTFLELIQNKYEYGITEIYPIVDIKEDKLYLNKLAYYNNEIYTLNDIESITYNMITNKIDKSSLDIPCNDKIFSITIDNVKTKYNYNNDFMINISFDSKIDEYTCDYDLNSNESINILTTQINENVEKNVLNLINISQKNNTDFIGFGNYIYKITHKKENNYLEKLNFKVKSNTTIISLGESR